MSPMDETLAEIRRRWGAEIKRLREAHGASADDLALEVGVSQATVSRWERGLIEPSTANKLAIAKALGVSAGRLFSL